MSRQTVVMRRMARSSRPRAGDVTHAFTPRWRTPIIGACKADMADTLLRPGPRCIAREQDPPPPARPASAPARPCSQAPAAAASQGGIPCASSPAMQPGQHVAGTGRRQPGRRGGVDRGPAVGRGDDRIGALQQHDRTGARRGGTHRGNPIRRRRRRMPGRTRRHAASAPPRRATRRARRRRQRTHRHPRPRGGPPTAARAARRVQPPARARGRTPRRCDARPPAVRRAAPR